MPTPPKAPAPTSIPAIHPDLQRLHELAGFHAVADKDLTALHAKLDRDYLELIQAHKDEVFRLSQNKESTLAAIEEIARQHPEWFGSRKELKTPVGTLKFRATSRLEIRDENDTLVKLLRRADRVVGFDATIYFREKITLDKEALEKLPEATLRRVGVLVVVEDKVSFKLATVDLKDALAADVPAHPAAA